jgi:hypothetical protein
MHEKIQITYNVYAIIYTSYMFKDPICVMCYDCYRSLWVPTMIVTGPCGSVLWLLPVLVGPCYDCYRSLWLRAMIITGPCGSVLWLLPVLVAPCYDCYRSLWVCAMIVTGPCGSVLWLLPVLVGPCYNCCRSLWVRVINHISVIYIDRGFETLSDQTKDDQIGICCFSAKHAALRRKSKDGL